MFVSEMLVEPLGVSSQGLARRVPHSISVTERIGSLRWPEAASVGGRPWSRTRMTVSAPATDNEAVDPQLHCH
jgi:hypothetical protein